MALNRSKEEMRESNDCRKPHRIECLTYVDPAVYEKRRALTEAESLDESRKRVLGEIERLPPSLRTLEPAQNYPCTVSEALRRLAREVDTAQLQYSSPTTAENKSASSQGLQH